VGIGDAAGEVEVAGDTEFEDAEAEANGELEAAAEAEVEVAEVGKEGPGGLLVLNAQMTSCIRFA
jgi:hypothetical protein